MGRPRKPPAILALTGAYIKNPSRAIRRTNEPLPKGPIGDPPKYFNDFLRKFWAEIVADGTPGVIMGSDRFALEVWCQVIAFIRLGVASPAMVTFHKSYDQQFGMTPVARSLVSAPEDENGNEFMQARAEAAAAREVYRHPARMNQPPQALGSSPGLSRTSGMMRSIERLFLK